MSLDSPGLLYLGYVFPCSLVPCKRLEAVAIPTDPTMFPKRQWRSAHETLPVPAALVAEGHDLGQIATLVMAELSRWLAAEPCRTPAITKASVLAMHRAKSRAPSWIERRILRPGSFGVQRGFSGQTSQSVLLAR